MRKITFILILFPLILICEEFILIKQVWGDVQLINSDKINKLVNYDEIEKNQKIKFISNNSKIWVKDNYDNHLILKFSNDKKEYSFADIKDLLKSNNDIESKDNSLWKKFISLVSLPDSESEGKVNGMIISPPTFATRNLFNSKVEIFIYEKFPLEINCKSLFEDTDLNVIYEFKVFDKSGNILKHKKNLDKPSLFMDFSSINGFKTKYNMEVSSSFSEKKILANLNFKILSPNDRKLLHELKDLAFSEIKSSECFYQIIFIEALLSNNLKANANYFLNLFNSNSDNIEIQELHQKYN